MNVKNNQSGQVLLVIVLLITVVLTVGLSIATRSIINIRLATQEDQSQRAFSAAEAGLEQSLLTDTSIENARFSNNSSFSTAVSKLTGNNLLLNNGKLVLKDEGTDLWLSQYSPESNKNYANPWTGTLTIYWGNQQDVCDASPSLNTMAALEVILITGNRNNPVTSHYAFDPCIDRRASNQFSSTNAGGTIGNKTFANSVQVPIGTNGLLARIIPLYANTYLGIQGTSALPEQGTLVTSTGSAGDVQRKVTVLRENPKLPAEVFSYTFLWPR